MKTPTRARGLSRTVASSGVAIALVTGLAAVACAGPSVERAPVNASAQAATVKVVSKKNGVKTFARPIAKTLPSNGTPVEAPSGRSDYTFLSAPDFMNLDAADVSVLPTWRKGLPNSWNSSYAQVVSTIMGTFKSERPDDVFVAGDLVEGHWGEDYNETGIFGPAQTNAQKKAALNRAADFYFSQWRARFDKAGLPVYAAVGDHDIGDNPWKGGSNPEGADFKRNNISTFKSAFYRNVMAKMGLTNRPAGPAHGTAFAAYVNPEVLLVTVDVFKSTNTDVIAELDPQQLAWLDGVLDAANKRGTDWIIVQGHTPVITPVRTYGSSALSYTGGTKSSFWKTLVKHKVDIYLNGEVHDVSVERADGVTQISHGGTIQMATGNGKGATNYTLGQIFGDKMFLRNNRFTPKMIDSSGELWQTSRGHRPVVRKEIWDNPLAIGHMVLTSDNRLLYSDGAFIPYKG